ncbi:ATP-grasp domain-containing protein [Bacillus sp. FJAT-45066]|uniref:ATP-grasp domain-containing protein n=1 Tax=Bacillus sp. FJAT-45066 TaxID=2011010 RepID=UPI000BB742A4|nr:ATP-grasp domain-containing protein [Bacillus sp. FJAT-45066]
MQLTGWIIYEDEHASKNKAFIHWFLEEAPKLNINLHFYVQSDISFGVKNNHLFIEVQKNKAPLPDFVIMRDINPLFSKQIESLGLPCFNSSFVSSICNDKAFTHQLLASHNIPMLDTYFANRKTLLITKKAPLPFPFVLKTRTGRSGKEVFLIQNERELAHTLELLENNDLILQPLAGSPGKDVRVFIVGKTIVGAVLRYNDNDFKANYTLGGQAKEYLLSDEEIRIVENIISLFPFGMAGIDFLFDIEGKFLFNEIEDVVGCRTLCEVTDINVVKLYLEFICEQVTKGVN